MRPVNTYVQRVDAYWADAQAERAPDAPTCVSTFAGGGGSSTGYHMAGFREVKAVEWDDHAVDTLGLNYPHLDIYHGDIAAMSVDEVLSKAGLKKGELSLLDGSPPCQGFSLMGGRALDDPRNGLFREYVRLLDGLAPKTFVMENVKGMTLGKMKAVYHEAMTALRGAGPGYRTVSGILNSGYFGVPQLRERLIVIGVREDLGITPTLPAPEMCPPTVREALRGLDSGPTGFQIHANFLTAWGRTLPGRDFSDLHVKGHMFSHTKIHPDKASPTILKTVGVQRDGQANNGLYHWRYPRLLTIPELKRIGSFPDAYQFAESGDAVKDFSNAWARVGNSVPPLMTRAIARHIRATILDRA